MFSRIKKFIRNHEIKMFYQYLFISGEDQHFEISHWMTRPWNEWAAKDDVLLNTFTRKLLCYYKQSEGKK